MFYNANRERYRFRDETLALHRTKGWTISETRTASSSICRVRGLECVGFYLTWVSH